MVCNLSSFQECKALCLERAVSASSLSLACNSMLVSPEGFRLVLVSSDKAEGFVQLLI